MTIGMIIIYGILLSYVLFMVIFIMSFKAKVLNKALYGDHNVDFVRYKDLTEDEKMKIEKWDGSLPQVTSGTALVNIK